MEKGESEDAVAAVLAQVGEGPEAGGGEWALVLAPAPCF